MLLLGVGGVTLIGTACGLFTLGGDTNPPTSLPPRIDNTARIAAITASANSPTGLCADIRPFYWEIGDRLGRVAGGTVNRAGTSTTYAAQTPMPIGAASQWIYAVYVAQRRQAILTLEDIQLLTLRSGYTGFSASPCDASDTVAQCASRGTNSVLNSSHVGKFFYGSGHLQQHAVQPAPGMSLGSLTTAALGTELQRVLGTDIDLAFTTPQLADGIRTTPAGYALFLQKILGSKLRFGFLLGTNATCTSPGTAPRRFPRRSARTRTGPTRLAIGWRTTRRSVTAHSAVQGRWASIRGSMRVWILMDSSRVSIPQEASCPPRGVVRYSGSRGSPLSLNNCTRSR